VDEILKKSRSVRRRVANKNKDLFFSPIFLPIPRIGNKDKSPAKKDPILTDNREGDISLIKRLEYKKYTGGIHRVERSIPSINPERTVVARLSPNIKLYVGE
jgi:hypothetical protein